MGVNEVAQKDFDSILHLRENISFYVEGLLDYLHPRQIRFVLVQEALAWDVRRMLNVDDVPYLNENHKSGFDVSLSLTEKGRVNLRQYLSEDYAAVRKLLQYRPSNDALWDALLE
ncbi:UNVERIFIED_CONTAM: hypothetical protein K0B97_06205 [Spiribacter pallidus]|jgi:hypothetical protein